MFIVDKATMFSAEKLAASKGDGFFTLMKRAGKASADFILQETDLFKKRVVILCGKGNNGGDGFVIARELSVKAAAEVTVVLALGEPITEISKRAFGEMGWEINVLSAKKGIEYLKDKKPDLIIDAVFGTGYNGEPPSEEIGRLFELAEKSDYAVDVPSGIECDSGRGWETALPSDTTLTFAAKKLCHILPHSADVCSRVVCLDIGIDGDALRESGAYITENERPVFKKRAKTSFKNDYGIALSVTGSYGMSGAAIISSRAALRTGVGILKLACIEQNYTACATALPEAVLLPLKSDGKTFSSGESERLKEELQRADALLVGCGLGLSDNTKRLTRELLLAAEIPVVLDADGINALAFDIELLRQVKAEVVLTPHPGEMARLCGITAAEVERDRIGIAEEFSERYGVYTVLKGANTVIASPDGQLIVNTTGNAGMATAGSGDMLAGVILALLAKGYSPLEAARYGVWLHSAAGDAARELLGEEAMLPSDMTEQLYKFL